MCVCVSGDDDDDDDAATGRSGCYSYPVPIKHVQLVPVRSGRPDVCPLQIGELTIHDPEKLLYGATAWGAHKHTETSPESCFCFILQFHFSEGFCTKNLLLHFFIIIFPTFLWPLHLNAAFATVPLEYNWPLLWFLYLIYLCVQMQSLNIEQVFDI